MSFSVGNIVVTAPSTATFSVTATLNNNIMTVSNVSRRTLLRGAGAVPLAACLAGLLPELKGKNVVLPLSGGNIDTPILGRVLERGLVSDGRLYRFTANISDRPGGLARFAGLIAEVGASIIEITHDRAFCSDDIATVSVHCVVETRDVAHIAELRQRLGKEGFAVSPTTEKFSG